MSLILNFGGGIQVYHFPPRVEISKEMRTKRAHKRHPPKYRMFRMVGGEQDTPPYHDLIISLILNKKGEPI